jgi:cysteine desulfurase
MKPIYMDHHATTPLDPQVLDAMMPYLTSEFGNPASSTHEWGKRARLAVEKAREQVASFIGCLPEEIVFTSGATESDNLALKGIAWRNHEKKGRIITIATEHKAILDTCKRLQQEGYEIVWAPIDAFGRVQLDKLAANLTPDTIMVSVQAANSEIGTTQPLQEIGALTRAAGIPFHTDAVQALGRMEIKVDPNHVDLLSISAHKMYGPKGVGALYVRKGLKLHPLIDGGGHERGMRSGTLNVPGIVGLGAAAEIAVRDLADESPRLQKLQARLKQGIESRIELVHLNGHPEHRLPNNLNYSFAYVEGESLIMACRQVALSSGSACTSANLQSSYVLRAINVPDSLAHCSIRFGLGKSNDEEQIDFLLELLVKHVPRLREMSPLYEMAREGIDIDSFSWSKHDHEH